MQRIAGCLHSTEAKRITRLSRVADDTVVECAERVCNRLPRFRTQSRRKHGARTM